MALLYVVVRGVSLGSDVAAIHDPASVVGALRDNVLALAPAAPWFLLSFAMWLVELYVGHNLVTDLVAEPVGSLAATTGLLTVVLYAVTVGSARLRQVV